MALPSIKTSFAFNHADQQDNLGQAFSGDFNAVQTALDSRAEELRVLINQLLYALDSATDGSSGADNIKATAIADVTGSTVQTILEDLKGQIDTIVGGGIPAGSVTIDKLDSGIIGSRTYTENNYIVDDEAVGVSIEKLDIALKDRQDNIDTLTGEIGTTTYTEKNYIADTDSLATSVDKLDMAMTKIIETGSNANGVYIKFEDGTMIQKHAPLVNVTTAVSGALHYKDFTWTFPIPFYEVATVNPVCTLTAGEGVGASALAILTDYSTFRAWYVGALTNHNQSMRVTAIGRWKA